MRRHHEAVRAPDLHVLAGGTSGSWPKAGRSRPLCRVTSPLRGHARRACTARWVRPALHARAHPATSPAAPCMHWQYASSFSSTSPTSGGSPGASAFCESQGTYTAHSPLQHAAPVMQPLHAAALRLEGWMHACPTLAHAAP